MSFVSRAGEKLEYALDTFGVDVSDKVCADFGSSTGGFVDCLIQKNCKKVYSVDTSYGELDWNLRNNPKVSVLERTNALHVELPEKVDIITIDTGWTKQEKIISNAIKNIKTGGVIVSLIKPQYEFENEVDKSSVEKLANDVAEQFGLKVVGFDESPIKGKRAGNTEYLVCYKF